MTVVVTVQPHLGGADGYTLDAEMPDDGSKRGRPPTGEPQMVTVTARVPLEVRLWVDSKGGSAWLREHLSNLRIREISEAESNK